MRECPHGKLNDTSWDGHASMHNSIPNEMLQDSEGTRMEELGRRRGRPRKMWPVQSGGKYLTSAGMWWSVCAPDESDL